MKIWNNLEFEELQSRWRNSSWNGDVRIVWCAARSLNGAGFAEKWPALLYGPRGNAADPQVDLVTASSFHHYLMVKMCLSAAVGSAALW